MISLAVSRGGRGVGVGRKVMEFCGSIVRALWHDVSPGILDDTYSALLPRLGAVCVLSMMSFDWILLRAVPCGPSRAGRPVDAQQDFCSLAARFRTSQCCLQESPRRARR